MKVFLSWSGERSKQVANLLSSWLSDVMQHVKPWFSPEMDRGTVWFNQIFEALSDISVGVICITRENLNAPWILFESGAIAKGVSSNRVCTLLIDIKPEDISPPLSQFNASLPTHESMFALVKTINEASGEMKLSEEQLKRAFDVHWPIFDREFKQILKDTKPMIINKTPPPRSQEEILSEILTTVRRIERNVTDTSPSNLAASRPNNNELAEDISDYERKMMQKYAMSELFRRVRESKPSPSVTTGFGSVPD